MDSVSAREQFLSLIKQPFDIDAVTAFRVQLDEGCADAHMKLIEARASRLLPKDAQWTDMDRRIMLEGFVAETETELRKLETLSELCHDWFIAKAQLEATATLEE